MNVVVDCVVKKNESENNRPKVNSENDCDFSEAVSVKVDNGSSKVNLVRGNLPSLPGIYVRGSVNNAEIWFTVDTGASCTIISEKVFKEIQAQSSSELTCSQAKIPLQQADGQRMKDVKSCQLDLQFGPVLIKKEVNIANISDQALLGMDIGALDVISTEGKVVIEGNELPAFQVRLDRSQRVQAAEDFIIPALSEVVIPVEIGKQPSQETDLLIEPSNEFMEKYSLIVASSLVNSHATEKLVRILNPGVEDVKIRKNVQVGVAEFCEDSKAVHELGVYRAMDEVEGSGSLPGSGKVKGDRLVSPESERTIVSPEGGMDVESVKLVEECRNLQDSSHTGTCHRTDAAESQELEDRLPEHLRVLFRNGAANHPIEVQKELFCLLNDFQGSFSKDDTDLGLTTLTEHQIDTGDAKPVKQPPRRPPLALAGEEKKAIDQMLQQGIIQKSTSPWASPIVLVKKKNGKIRTCIDYRRLNSVTKKDAYPIPRTQECLDALSESAVFSTLDLTSGYHQVPVQASDISKTAFVSRHGLYEFKAAPFGLTNMPATFQRVMELALQGLQWTTCLIYLDDVIIFGATHKEHFQRLRQVLQRIQEANFKLKPGKCELMKKEVEFLGHIVSQKGVRPNPHNTRKIQDWSAPSTVTEVRQFLGLCSYYRRFVKNFSILAKPLFDLTKKESPLQWTTDCQNAFDKLKQHLLSPDIMAYPLDQGGYTLDTDACNDGIGAVLSQMQDGKERVIAYASRSLSKSERNYCVTDKELLAVVYFIDYFRHYLLGRNFVTRTDHQALKWLFTIREPKGRIARWIELLSSYNFCIEYRPGRQHGNADGLSRCPNPRDCECPLQDPVDLRCGPCKKCKRRAAPEEPADASPQLARRVKGTPSAPKRGKFAAFYFCFLMFLCSLVKSCFAARWFPKIYNPVRASKEVTADNTPMLNIQNYWASGFTVKELQKAQDSDPSIGKVKKWKQENKRPYGTDICSEDPESRHYWNYWNSLEVHDDIIFKRRFEENGTSFLQFLVPKSLRDRVLFQAHNTLLTGHMGRKKTIFRVKQHSDWYRFREDIYDWLQKCKVCGANKKPTRSPKASPGDMRVGAPMDRWSIDILGRLPLTPRGNRYILVVCDGFSKWTEAFPVPDQTAETCARVLMNEMVSRLGCPLDLHSDQGRNFESSIFAEICRLLEIRKTRTTPRHPEGNGQVERFNRTLIPMIRAFIKGEQQDWDLYLGCLTGAYRATIHETTKYTPNMLMLGRETRGPGEFFSFSSVDQEENYGTYVSKLKNRLEKAHQIVRKHLSSSVQRQKGRHDAKAALHKFQVGDAVWYLAERRSEGVNPKLLTPYIGPCIIMQQYNNIDFRILMDSAGKERVVHYNKLRPYECQDLPRWVKNTKRKLQKKT